MMIDSQGRERGRNRWETTQGVASMESEGAASLATLAAPKRAGGARREEATPWVVLLAGGEGRRLQEFTATRDGVVVPKQFCHFRDERSLLATSIDRALRIAPRDQVLVVVMEAHREWWEPDVSRIPRANVLPQPLSRGTAIAILHALIHIRKNDPSPRIVVMPSDHDFEDENSLVRAVRRALRTAELFPTELLLLGIAPSHLDADYGMIEPGKGVRHASRPVRSFVEKPTLSTAARLAHDGALWNSFIFACTGSALYDLFRASLPELLITCQRELALAGGDSGRLASMYERLPECDFSRDVLQPNAGRLRVVELRSAGWTDLGTPARLAGWLDRHREAIFWREHNIPRLFGTDGLAGAPATGGA